MNRLTFISKVTDPAELRRRFLDEPLEIINLPMTDGNYDDSNLDDEVKVFDGGVRIFAYSYGTAPYEGYGEAIFLNRKGKWDYTSLSHCSCNGPLEDFNWDTRGGLDSLDELIAKFSKDLQGLTGEIIKELKKRGY